MATPKWELKYQVARGEKKEMWMKKRNAKILNSEEYTHTQTHGDSYYVRLEIQTMLIILNPLAISG